MKWLKVPIDDEIYQALYTTAEVLGFSPEEFIAKMLMGAFKTSAEMIATGRGEKLREILRGAVGKELMRQLFSVVDMPREEKGLWTP